MKKSTEFNITRGEYISLGKAVAKFNRTINELKTEENKTYLPEEYDYKYLKDRIVTKSELKRYVKELRNFGNNNIGVYETAAGEKLTEWENDILQRERKRALQRMNKDLKNATNEDTIDTLKSNIQNLKNFQNVKGLDFRDLKRRIHKIGDSDYKLRKAIQYRENYMKALEDLKNYKYYDKYVEKLNSIKSPYNFFKYVNNVEELTDLFVYYKDEDIVIGNYTSSEDTFNTGLVKAGILSENEIE